MVLDDDDDADAREKNQKLDTHTHTKKSIAACNFNFNFQMRRPTRVPRSEMYYKANNSISAAASATPRLNRTKSALKIIALILGFRPAATSVQ